MTVDVEPREKLTVVITQAPGTKRYRRPFVGLTVTQAIGLLEEEDNGNLDFPCVHGVKWFLNRERIDPNSQRVLQKGDILKTEDPPKNH